MKFSGATSRTSMPNDSPARMRASTSSKNSKRRPNPTSVGINYFFGAADADAAGAAEADGAADADVAGAADSAGFGGAVESGMPSGMATRSTSTGAVFATLGAS